VSPRASDDDDEIEEAPHPRVTTLLFGHAQAEQAMLSAYRSGRMPHAFLIAGPKGIGKATLAYRLARFVLAHPDPAARAVQAARSLEVDAKNPVARRIAAQAQPDFLVLERTLNDKGVLHKQIQVDDIRKTVTFFGSTAGEGGVREIVCGLWLCCGGRLRRGVVERRRCGRRRCGLIGCVSRGVGSR